MKLLLTDKDGTLIAPASGAKFVNQPWDQAPLPGASEAIAKYAADGWTIAIISNQGGVAGGHKSLESAILEMQFCLKLFPQIQEAYFCPDFDGLDCWRVWGDCSPSQQICYGEKSFQSWELALKGTFRKPNAGMLRLAMAIHSPDQVLYTGDMLIANSPKGEDENAALSAGIPFIAAPEFLKIA
jgi:D-glycero-D-manno-heptose 1,7-bisphosphate phosphatase